MVVKCKIIASREHIPTEMLGPKLDGITASEKNHSGKAEAEVKDGDSVHAIDGIAVTHPGTNHKDLGIRDLHGTVNLGIRDLIQGT